MNNEKKVTIIALVALLIIVIGASYAFFTAGISSEDSTTIKADAGTMKINYDGGSNITLSGIYPREEAWATKVITVTGNNTTDAKMYYKLTLVIDSNTFLASDPLQFELVSTNTSNNGKVITSINKTNIKSTSIVLGKGSFDKSNNAKHTYELKIYYPNIDTYQNANQGKTFSAHVEIASIKEEIPTEFASAVLKNNEVKSPLSTPGASVSAYTVNDVTRTSSNVDSNGFYRKYYITYGTGWEKNGTKFNLTGVSVTSEVYEDSYASLVGKFLPASTIGGSGSSTAGETVNTTDLNYVYYVVGATSMMISYKIIASNDNQSEALLASTEDDYGTSYYFRGLVTNNYVEFADKCWRIVRIGGDNTVKLILHNDNTEKIFNPCSSANNSTTAAFAHYNGSKYTSSFNSNYKDNAGVGFMYGESGSSTYEETHANTNKSRILTNLETWYSNNLNDYESVIDDNVFCNDKTLFSGDGYGTIATKYGAYGRLVPNKTPSLKCASELSKIATKIGLITADEAAYAGYSAFVSSSLNYLEENAADGEWWTLSPSQKNGFGPRVWIVDGKFGELDENGTSETARVRPYISLKSSTKVTGEGTSENPYVVEEV